MSNKIMLRADNRPRLEWLPAAKEIEWICYGVILGRVILRSVAHTYIDDLSITTTSINEKAVVHAKTTVTNHGGSAVNMELTILVTHAKIAFKKTVPVDLPAGETKNVELDFPQQAV